MNCSPPLAPPWDERQAIAKESTLKLKAGPGRAWRTKPPIFLKGIPQFGSWSKEGPKSGTMTSRCNPGASNPLV